jgi:hypothetical protein
MTNSVKYSASAQTLALKKGDYWIGTGDVPKGPTLTTDYWSAIIPPTNGYTIYLNKASNGPSIYTPPDDASLIFLTNRIAGASYTTVAECLDYFAGENDKMVLNKNYGPVITNGLVLNYDAGFTPSYPRTGSTIYTMNGTPDGVLTNGATFNTDRIVLDGVDDYINLGTTPAINFTNGLTIEIEVNFTALGGTGWERFIDLNDSSGTLLAFGRHSVFSNVQFTCRNITGPDAALQRRYQSTGNPLATNQIAVYSVTLPAGTPGEIRTGCKLYKNGSEIAGALATADENPRLPSTQTRNVSYIGRSSSAGNAFLNGSVYWFRIYNRELSAAEILQNYNAS